MAEAPQFNPVEARTYLQGFGHEVDKIDDATLPTIYTKVKTGADTMMQGAVEKAIKERGAFAPEWRQAIAGEDAEALKTLERFQSPKALYDSYGEMRKKMSSGELKPNTPYPDKGTPEEQGAWRKDQGIPDKPEGYEIKPPEGVVFGKEDEPFLDGFKKHAFESNMTPDSVNKAVAWYGEERVRRQEAAAQQTVELKKQTDDKLRAEWGTEFRPTMTRIEGMLDATTGGDAALKDSIMASVTTNPAFARFLADLAFKVNPTGTLTPGDGATQLGSVEDGIKKIEGTMRSNRKAYDKDEKMQAEYRRYLDAYQRQTGKAWGTK